MTDLMRFLISLALLLSLRPLQCPAAPRNPPERPKIGLALSGGGARGAAHIGVLKALEREGLRPDFVAGSSFGSLIGGFYALGYSPDQIEEIFASLNWDNLFSDSPDRRLSPLMQRKNFRYLGELSFDNFTVDLPAGLWGGQKLTELLNYYTTTRSLLEADYDYDRLRIPFRAVATDLLTGKAYVFRNGPMTQALRASVAIPMMFTPVEKDEMLLVDGGLANNLPTDVVRDMGAELVIAVDATSPLLEKDRIHSIFDVMDQSISLLMKQSVEANLKLADLVIRPELDGFTYSSYARIREIASRGEQAALDLRDKLLELKGEGAEPPLVAPGAEPASPMLDSIGIEVARNMNPLLLLRELRSRPGKRMDAALVRGDLARLYATRMFSHVDYDLLKVREDHYVLSYKVQESSLRTLGASIRYDPDYEFVGLAEITSRAMMGTPTSATLSSQFGGLDNHSAALRLIHPALPFFFAEPMVQYRKLERLDIREKKLVDKFSDTRFGGQLMLGGTFLKRLEVALGYRFDRVRISGGTAPKRQDNGENLAGIRLHLRRDSLDEQEYPNSGMLLDLRADNRSKALGGDFSFSTIQGDFQRLFSISDSSTLRVRLAGLYSSGDIPFYEQLFIGGYNFSELASTELLGLARDELATSLGGTGTLGYRHRIFSRPLSFVRRGYVSVQYNTAAVSQSTRRPREFTLYHGAGVGLLLDTMIGPLRFAAGVAEGGRGKFYLSIGPSF